MSVFVFNISRFHLIRLVKQWVHVYHFRQIFNLHLCKSLLTKAYNYKSSYLQINMSAISKCTIAFPVQLKREDGFHLDLDDYLMGLLLLASELVSLYFRNIYSNYNLKV